MDLLLSLGHGSSAVAISGQEIVGYQTERLTGVKGDSYFPALAISEICKHSGSTPISNVYISHWSASGDVHAMSRKHWNKALMDTLAPEAHFHYVSPRFTHHDAHALSVLAYDDKPSTMGSHIIVADGFGNLGETISVYSIGPKGPALVYRSYGLTSSIGLLYQFATDFVGWRQNRDEWKLNAAAHKCDTDRPSLNILANETANHILACGDKGRIDRDDPVTNPGALTYTHMKIFNLLNKHFLPTDVSDIAYFLQKTVEKVMLTLLHRFSVTNLYLAGGSFLNVQLNGFIAQLPRIKRLVVMPLSGDEGAPLGVYRQLNPKFHIGDNLCWGKRALQYSKFDDVKKLHVIPESKFQDEVRKCIEADKIVNVVYGDMEFGPRSLCHTSTIARPTSENVSTINVLNNRFGMPMCPVMTEEYCDKHVDLGSTVKSYKHMIVTGLVKPSAQEALACVSHPNLVGQETCRPQVVDESSWIYPLVEKFGPLINTSFNNHGHPICYNEPQIILNHNNMVKNDYDNKVVTLVCKMGA